MFDENSNPIAQGQQAEAGDSAPQGNQDAPKQGSNPGDGIQKRIDELTARFHEERRAAQAKDQQIAELVRALAERSSQPAQQQAADPFEGFEPEERQKFAAVLNPLQERLRQYEAYLPKVQAMEARLAEMQFKSAASQMGFDEGVQQRAMQLMQTWRNKGYTGWNPEDALTFAAGQLAMEDRQRNQTSRDERGRFNGGSQSLVGGHAAPTSPNPRQPDAVPADLESWDPAKQAEFWEKRLGNKGF